MHVKTTMRIFYKSIRISKIKYSHNANTFKDVEEWNHLYTAGKNM